MTIPLGSIGAEFEDALQEQFHQGVDVVLDYLWGPSAERIITAGAKAAQDPVPIRFVHIGAVSGANISLPSAALRSSAIELKGSGIGSISIEGLVKSIGDLLQAAVPGGFAIATKTFPLREVETVWTTAGTKPRVVFQIP